MKSIFNPILLLTVAMLAGSCGNPAKQTAQASQTEEVQEEDAIGTLRELHVTNTAKVGGKDYTYEYDFVHDETLPIVRNPQGDDYYDNCVRLSIEQDGKEVLVRTFTKRDFKDVVPEQFMSASALVGFTYNYTKTDMTDALYFIATVGDPDETADMVFPVQVKVSPSGQVTLEKADNLDTEPINPMTIDPTD